MATLVPNPLSPPGSFADRLIRQENGTGVESVIGRLLLPLVVCVDDHQDTEQAKAHDVRLSLIPKIHSMVNLPGSIVSALTWHWNRLRKELNAK